MSKSKILSLGLASSLFMFGMNLNANAVGNSGIVFELKDNKLDEIEGYSKIDILGSEYDLVDVNSAVIQAIAKMFDIINENSIPSDKIDEYKKEIKYLLDDYNKDPKKYETFPMTLEIGPATFLRDEIIIVQNKIKDLRIEQDNIKISDNDQSYIDQKVNELQRIIDSLSNWINYSVVNFKSSEYKQTFTEDLFKTNETDVRQLISIICTDREYKDVYSIRVNSDGSFSVDGKEISDLSDIIKNGLEYENLKIRNLNKEIEMVKSSKISTIDQDNIINELNKQIENVKAYSLGQEIILLNLEIDSIKSSKLSIEAINARVEELISNIKVKLESLKNHNINPEYVIKDFEIGKAPVYFGYVLEGENGFSIKLSLDSNSKIFVENVIGDGYEFTDDQRNMLRNILIQKIDDSTKKISEFKNKKLEILEGLNENKYYLVNSIEKDIAVLENDISNYKIMIAQI